MNKGLFILPLAAFLMMGCNSSGESSQAESSSQGSEPQTSESSASTSQGGGSESGEIKLDFISSNRTAGTDSYIWEKDGFKVTNSKGSYDGDFAASLKDDHARFYAASALKFEYAKPIKKMVFKCWVWSGKNGASLLAAESWSAGAASAGEEYTEGDYHYCDCTWELSAGATEINISSLAKQTRVSYVTMTF